MRFFGPNSENGTKEQNEKRTTHKNINLYRKCLHGEQLIDSENEADSKKIITGGSVDSFEVANGVVMVGADSKFGAKNGTDGSEIACKAIKYLFKIYDEIYETEDRLIKAITNDSFSKQLSGMWKEMVLVYNENKIKREKELQKQEKERKFSFSSFLGLNNDKKQEEQKKEEQEKENVDASKVDEKEVLKDYATSVAFAFITKNNYLLATLGQCGFILFNAYEGKKMLGNIGEVSLLGETPDIKLHYEQCPQDNYSGILMTSEKLGCLLSDVKSGYKYARQLEKTSLKSYDSADPFTFLEENGVKNNLATVCKEYGLYVSLAVNSQFKLSPEKEREYKDAILNKTIEEGKKARLLKIQQNLEIAKDRSVYENYENTTYDGYENVKIFSARRQGRSHVDGNTPCQDYCLTSKVDKGIVLAVSDGVGSCSRSDMGSKFACESLIDVVKFADEKSNDEELFVSLLQSVDFRQKVFSAWRNTVIRHISQEKGSGQVTLNEVFEYAATLLFAVITENYYVVGNLGDGQILLYNQDEATKIRKHSPKESSKTRSLVNYNGFSEAFIVEKYRRSEFSSVLLSTDGMYDPLENGDEFYKYAKETEKRFLEKNEPYQPFCYTVDEEEGYKEIFSSNTYDDCTVILATDVSFNGNGKDLRRKGVEERYNYTIVESIGDVSVYASNGDNGSYTTVVSKNKVTQPKIDGINFFNIEESYEKDGYYYNVYNYTDAMNVNKMYQFAVIGEQGETKPNASYLTLKIYEDIMECIDILDKSGYALDQQLSHNLIVYSEESGLRLYPEAVIKKEDGKTYDNRRIRAYFDSLYGKLVCGDVSYPLFNVDFNNVGGSKFLTPNGDSLDYLGVVRRVGDKLYLENCGAKTWCDMNDNPVNKGERILLSEGELFKIKGLLKTNVYSFVEKKNFR